MNQKSIIEIKSLTIVYLFAFSIQLFSQIKKESDLRYNFFFLNNRFINCLILLLCIRNMGEQNILKLHRNFAMLVLQLSVKKDQKIQGQNRMLKK